ncbi:hypothetical protein PsorP6_014522 [Peronosclerospora sorghi]|uniref:Uncharacterized protein n=1 Tax=Peronosclerospora sorghi TaxID=230839 RepID=A0ACC0VSR8_9STRA|nr:hypothetical protein PsorP6_014522 [Peronosclerospora sorghi]
MSSISISLVSLYHLKECSKPDLFYASTAAFVDCPTKIVKADHVPLEKAVHPDSVVVATWEGRLDKAMVHVVTVNTILGHCAIKIHSGQNPLRLNVFQDL